MPASDRPPIRFLSEPDPVRGVATEVAPGIRRIVAENPGPMTYRGTNTYLLHSEGGALVIDPGPVDTRHAEAIVAATGGRVSHILLTHRHRDHAAAAPALASATGAPIAAFGTGAAGSITADIRLKDGDVVAGLVALHTPGHAADHLCFARADGVLFSGDHVMSWQSSVIDPPDGDMIAYFASLERLLRRNDRLLLPGHGPPFPDPRGLAGELLAHRKTREASIARALGDAEALAILDLVDRIYGPLDPPLRLAAARSAAAHLEKLRAEGRAVEASPGVWRSA